TWLLLCKRRRPLQGSETFSSLMGSGGGLLGRTASGALVSLERLPRNRCGNDRQSGDNTQDEAPQRVKTRAGFPGLLIERAYTFRHQGNAAEALRGIGVDGFLDNGIPCLGNPNIVGVE